MDKMAERVDPDSDCDTQPPSCKRLKADLELTFSSHLELTNRLSCFEDCGPLLLSPPDSQNASATSSDPSIPHNESLNGSMCAQQITDDKETADTETDTASRAVPIDGSPVSPSDDVVAPISEEKVATEPEGESIDPEISTSTEDGTIEQPEETETTAPKEDDKAESQESGSEEVEVVQTKVAAGKKNKTVHQRKDIRKILSADQLEEETLAAQREESERRQRQRLLQRQQAMARVGQTWPFSMEDVMKSMANKGITMTVASEAPLSSSPPPCPIGDTDAVPKESEEVFITLSSDDEDSECTPINTRQYSSFNNSVPFAKEIFGGGMNNCGGTVTGGHKMEGEFTEISSLGSISLDKEIDKGAESDSSDDCVVISPPNEEEDTIEKYDDENNVPDELGRVLVNVGHPPEDPDIFLSPQIGKAVKPHQIGGIRFLYDNVVESMERFNSTGGLGCILAHSMGLGKTIQAAAFCDIFLRHTKANTVLVIVPINTVQNWLNEFNQWLPPSSSQTTSAAVGVPSRKYSRKKDKLKKKNDVKVELKDEELTSTSTSIGTPDEQNTSINSPNSNGIGDQQSKQSESPEAEMSNLDATIPTPILEVPTSTDIPQSEGGRSFSVYVLNETVKTLSARERIISQWTENRGVLLIGYEMYRMLSLKKLKKPNRKEKTSLNHQEENARLLKSTQEEAILEKIYSCLVKPGPDLVICDEGHRIKNSGASISQALKAIKTRRRVVLTGYPLQNNLMEYWCMVDFIRPSYLGTKAEFSNMFERPITNGQCADSTKADQRLMQFRSHVLHSLLEGFVQRRSHLVLQKALPAKQEWVFFLKMTGIQYELYKEFISYLRLLADMGNSTPNPIKAFAVCCKIWNHPDVLYNVVKKKQSILDDFEGLTEDVDCKPRKSKQPCKVTPDLNDNNYFAKANQAEFQDADSFPLYANYGYGPAAGSSSGMARDSKTTDSLLSLEWAATAFKNYVPGHLENGTKFELLFIIIEECLKVNDKLLVFSQSLLTLDLMETFLGVKKNWMKGRDYFRLDGSTSGLERERLINDFNGQNSSAHVFLVSTRAGSLGINLIGANRVVVFDASWNPCHDCQAVCRVYRYGQKKECQIYRFVTDCSLEKRIYDRQINKRGMANRVVDEMNPDSHFNAKDMSSTLHLEIDDLDRVQETTFGQDPMNYSDVVMQKVLSEAGSKITKEPFEHESLLIDRKDKKLSASERRMAHRNYEFEKNASNQVPAPNMIPNRQAYPPYYAGYQNPSLSNPAGPSMNGSAYDEQGNYRYGQGGRMGGSYYDKHSSNARPGDEMSIPRGSNEAFPLPVDELKRRGVSVQGIVLRKDSYLADPDGGPDIFLQDGDKVYLLRSYKGSYLRLANGRIIALRRRTKHNSFLDQIPPTQDLTKEQILHVINSIFRPRTTSTSSEQEYMGSGSRMKGMSMNQHYNGDSDVIPIPPSPPSAFPTVVNQFPYHHSMSVPLPPTHPYGNFLNQQNLQITNQRNSSGGDVTIWKQDAQSEKLKPRTQQDTDIIPDIEVIKLNPNPKQYTAHKNSQKLSSELSSNSRLGQPIRNSLFSHSHSSSSRHSRHSRTIPPPPPYPGSIDGRNNPAIVSALLSPPPMQNYFRSHSSHRSLNHGNSAQGTLKNPPILPSELSIQPVPPTPDLTAQLDTITANSIKAQAAWTPLARTSKTQLQNFDNFSEPNISDYFSDNNDVVMNGSGADFLQTGQELLSEFVNPPRAHHPHQPNGVAPALCASNPFQQQNNFSSTLNPFYPGASESEAEAMINNIGRFVQNRSENMNRLVGLNGASGGDIFYEDPFDLGSSQATDLSRFGQYYSRNPRISTTADASQSFSPQS